jgi:hypothetical protein
MSEPLTQLAELPSAEPDSARAERIRVRCRTRLGRQAPRASAWRGAAHQGGTVPIWQPLIVVLGVGYMAEVVIQALRVYGLL